MRLLLNEIWPNIRYEHRWHGSYICGGVALPYYDSDYKFAGFRICTPSTWKNYEKPMEEGDGNFFDGWTLDIWFDGKWFATLTIDEFINDEVFQFYEVPIRDPRNASWTPRLVNFADDTDITHLDQFSYDWNAHFQCWWERKEVLFRVSPTLPEWVHDNYRNSNSGEDIWPFYHQVNVCNMLRHLKKRTSQWSKVRRIVNLRSIVLFWEELTKYQMGPGGTAYHRDIELYRSGQY